MTGTASDEIKPSSTATNSGSGLVKDVLTFRIFMRKRKALSNDAEKITTTPSDGNEIPKIQAKEPGQNDECVGQAADNQEKPTETLASTGNEAKEQSDITIAMTHDFQEVPSSTSPPDDRPTIVNPEQLTFVKWINRHLADDEELRLACDPIDPKTNDLFERCRDGRLLCKLINLSIPGTVDERTLTSAEKHDEQTRSSHLDNLELAIRSAEAIGCQVRGIQPSDIYERNEELVLALLWEIIKIGLFRDIDLVHHPNLALLRTESENPDEVLKLSKEALLIRWVNYQLARSGFNDRKLRNFTSDVSDSIVYAHLLKEVCPIEHSPATSLAPLEETNMETRAELTMQEAEKLNANEFLTPQVIVAGDEKLNTAFVANLFNKYANMGRPKNVNVVAETSEEKTYRNWMNSLGVEPRVNSIYRDLQDCRVIFQLYDIIKPGCVEWSKVSQSFHSLRSKFQKLDNCNYAIELGIKELQFILVGVHGSNILNGDKMYTLAIVWQLMKSYILSTLVKIADSNGQPIVEKNIIEWTNTKLKSNDKTVLIKSFQDPVIGDSRVICDLIDCIRPHSVDYGMLNAGATNKEERMSNARYAISLTRKIGARVFALPEDIVELKPKMIMTIFAALMIKHFQTTKTQTG